MLHLVGGLLVDFVVSKVAMSVCALVVVGVLAGVVDNEKFTNCDQELAEVLERFSGLVDRAAMCAFGFATGWTVPLSSDGSPIDVSIHAGVVRAESGNRVASLQPSCELHTWWWNGSRLNLSSIRALDESSPRLDFVSSEMILVRTIEMTVENELRHLVFVSSFS